MLGRLSKVDHINVTIMSYSSILQIGDSQIVNGFSRAPAVQREAEIFYGNEGNLPDFRAIVKPIPLPPITEDITYRFHHFNPVIKVKGLDVIGVTNSSILHVGNSKDISLEARIMHIRQLLPFGHEHEMR